MRLSGFPSLLSGFPLCKLLVYQFPLHPKPPITPPVVRPISPPDRSLPCWSPRIFILRSPLNVGKFPHLIRSHSCVNPPRQPDQYSSNTLRQKTVTPFSVVVQPPAVALGVTSIIRSVRRRKATKVEEQMACIRGRCCVCRDWRASDTWLQGSGTAGAATRSGDRGGGRWEDRATQVRAAHYSTLKNAILLMRRRHRAPLAVLRPRRGAGRPPAVHSARALAPPVPPPHHAAAPAVPPSKTSPPETQHHRGHPRP